MKRALESFASHVPLLVLMFMLGAGFFLTAGDFPSGVWCFFKRVFGFDCPGCGLTHAFLAMPRGNFAAAWRYNPGAFPLYALFFAAFINRGNELFGYLLTKNRMIEFFLRSIACPSRYLFTLSQIAAATLFIQWVPKVVSYFQDHSVAGVFARLMGSGR